MQEPTDDQLDGLFRKSAEEFNTPFDPAAWQALKNRLDSHDRLTIWEHLLRWGIPVLLLLMLTGGSWNAHHQQTKAGQKPVSSVAAKTPNAANVNAEPTKLGQLEQPRADKGQPQSDESIANAVKPGNPLKTGLAQADDGKQPGSTVNPEPPVQRAAEAALAPVVSDRTRAGRADPTKLIAGRDEIKMTTDPVNAASTTRPSVKTSASTRLGRTERAGLSTRQQRPSRRPAERQTETRMAATFPTTDYAMAPTKSFTKQRATPDVTSEGLANKSQSGTGSLPIKETVGAVALPSFSELTIRPGQWPKPLSFASREVTAPLNAVEAKGPESVKPEPVQKGLSVRFVVSPDLSGIGFRNFQRPGTNVGLLLEYRLASRWSVQAGVMRSTKVYKALATEYKLPADMPYSRVKPESVSGRCDLLDIPINLRYDVALRPRLNGRAPSRWFVSGGATTYIMQREKYVYNYPAGTHIYSNTRKGESASTGLYGFSQLNLSMGYERALSRRLSWQVEPFVKVPLKGVGFFNVNLLSTGAFLSLRYKL